MRVLHCSLVTALAVVSIGGCGADDSSRPKVRSVEQALSTTFTNPVINTSVSVTDPFVVKAGSNFYAYTSAANIGGAKNVPVFTATGDLGSFSATAVDALPTANLGTWVDHTTPNVRAPTVIAKSGTDPLGHSYNYVLYYQAKPTGSTNPRIGVAIATSPTGPFHGEYNHAIFNTALAADAAGSFEPNVVFNTVFPILTWRKGGAPSTIYSRPMADSGLEWRAGSTPFLIYTANASDWHGGVVERPVLTLKGSQFFFFFSGRSVNTGARAGGWGVANGAFGVVTNVSNVTQAPWYRQAPSAQSPNGLTPFSDGTNWWVVYDAQPSGSCATSAGTCTGVRKLRIDKMNFSATPSGGAAIPRVAGPTTTTQQLARSSDYIADVPLDKDPIGLDAYRRLELLPKLQRGVQTKQFSSFDRDGGSADGGPFMLRSTPDGKVIAEAEGPGEIQSIWATRLGSPLGDVTDMGTLKIFIDGVAVVNHSLQGIVNGDLGPPFTNPLVANRTQSPSGVFIKVPMTFQKSMQVVVGEVGYYHVTYKKYADIMGVPSFSTADTAADVNTKLSNASTGTTDPKPPYPGTIATVSAALNVAPGASQTLATLNANGTITQFKLKLNTTTAAVLQNARIRMTFDGTQTVDAPAGEFFGSGLGQANVRALMFSMQNSDGFYRSFWPMPFKQSATIVLHNASATTLTGNSEVVWSNAPTTVGTAGAPIGYFRAESKRALTVEDQDWVFIDRTGTGKVVGINHTMWGDFCFDVGGGPIPDAVTYLEGDERVYAEGSRSPQIYGTGTEDLYEGGWYFETGNFGSSVYTPFGRALNGSPMHSFQNRTCGATTISTRNIDTYRTFIGDAMPFTQSLKFAILHGELFDDSNFFNSTYGSTTFWYGDTRVSSSHFDTLTVGSTDPTVGEAAHSWSCPTCSAATVLTSGFESDIPIQWALNARSLATGSVSFRMNVAANATHVRLRRLSDQFNAYQAATVSVDGIDVGIWAEPLHNDSSAGTNTFRWLDGDFDIPFNFIQGKSSITIKLTPRTGSPAWTQAQYVAISVVPPA